jgi:hypothetical protein
MNWSWIIGILALGATCRPLTWAERECAVEIFGASIDYDAVTITRGSPRSLFTATAIGNAVNLKPEHFAPGSMDLNRTGQTVLIHELGHVWQFQNGGLGYIWSSVLAQIAALVTAGSRRAAYDWRRAHNRSRPWHSWNAEQQAECISDYFVARDLGDPELIKILLPYIMQVQARSGAAGAKTSPVTPSYFSSSQSIQKESPTTRSPR